MGVYSYIHANWNIQFELFLIWLELELNHSSMYQTLKVTINESI